MGCLAKRSLSLVRPPARTTLVKRSRALGDAGGYVIVFKDSIDKDEGRN